VTNIFDRIAKSSPAKWQHYVDDTAVALISVLLKYSHVYTWLWCKLCCF